jgi:hypothetical protein
VAAAGSGADWWPCALLVGARDIAVYLTADRPPSPPGAPWRLGHDPHLWVIDRDALAAPSAGAARLVLIGYLDDALVLIDTSRLPGTLVVAGEGEPAERVRSLLRVQPAGAEVLARDYQADGGPHWRMDVDSEGVIAVNGNHLALALPPKAPELPAIWTTRENAREIIGSGAAVPTRVLEVPVLPKRPLPDAVADSPGPDQPAPVGLLELTDQAQASPAAQPNSGEDIESWIAMAVSSAAEGDQALGTDEDL